METKQKVKARKVKVRKQKAAGNINSSAAIKSDKKIVEVVKKQSVIDKIRFLNRKVFSWVIVATLIIMTVSALVIEFSIAANTDYKITYYLFSSLFFLCFFAPLLNFFLVKKDEPVAALATIDM